MPLKPGFVPYPVEADLVILYHKIKGYDKHSVFNSR